MGIRDYVKDRRILAFIVLVAIFAILDLIYGIHLGIDFAGGIQIPIALQSPADAVNMSLMTSIISQRISTFGLSNPNVYGEGNSQIIVQLANASQDTIQGTIKIIESQGQFQGIVNGREAVNGTGIITDTVAAAPLTITSNSVGWQVNFEVSPAAAVRFAKVTLGQANQQIYFFLDRPSNAIVLLNYSIISNPQYGLTPQSYQVLLEKATALGNQSIPIQIISSNASNWNATLYQYFKVNSKRYDQVILAKNTPGFIVSDLKALNYTVVTKNTANMTPVLFPQGSASGIGSTADLEIWPAIGLLYGPTLSPGIAQGIPSQQYLVTGSSPPNMTSSTARLNFSEQQAKTISSILRGGALPIPVIVGAPTTIPPTLGKHAELISAVAALIAVLSVTAVIVIRYRKLFLIGPIILTTLGELFIIASILGIVGGIDLAAVAGMIAVVGTGVDAQIIISDELLVQHSESGTMKSKLNRAFYIVWADAALVTIAMMPLLFSTSLLTVIGFAESTLIGALLGAFITRPAYGHIISRHYSRGSDA